jgi:lipopolysaccharide assembly outer membrane protein LptD (OstA)
MIMKRSSKIVFLFVIFVLFFLPVLFSAQESSKEKMTVGGDVGYFKKNYTRFEGNAYVEKGTVRMTANSIEYFETNNLAICRGSVVLNESKNGLKVYGGYSEYFGDSNVIKFYDSPSLTLTNKNIFLIGDTILLDQKKELIVSEGNAILSNESFVGSSHKIKVLSKGNKVIFISNATIVSSNISVKSGLGIVYFTTNRESKEMVIEKYVGVGEVEIFDGNSFLKSSNIVINFFPNGEIKDYVATGNVLISNSNTLISSEYFRSVFTNKNKDIYHVGLTNVILRDLRSGDIIRGEYLFSDKVNNYEMVSINAEYISKEKGVTVKAETIERFTDGKFVYMRKNVIIETESIKIVGEIAKYDEILKYMYVVGDPKVVSKDDLGISANYIVLDVDKDRIEILNGSYGYVKPGM